MGRALRIDAPGTWHHVMNRGAGRRSVFRDDGDRIRFVELLGEVDDRFGAEIHAFCLMGNHYHLLVRSRDGRLSEAVGWHASQFTRSANAARGVDGAIFRGRFHSVAVCLDDHLDWLLRYVNANPLDIGWTGRLADYPWSGLSTTLGHSDRFPWLRVEFARSRFGARPSMLESFVEAARSDVPRLDIRGVTEDRIAASVEIARAPGPVVHSEAEVRAAHTLLAQRAGLDPIKSLAHLDERQRRKYLHRVARRLGGDELLQRFVRRAESVLAVERTGAPSGA